MVCVIDDDEHHYTECNRCNGDNFGTPECKPEKCPICEERGHESSYLRVMRNYYIDETGRFARVKQ